MINPPTVFEDFRGTYLETYNEEIYWEAGIRVKFVQDDFSISKKNVLRGIHGDVETWKLISCVYGKIYLVIVNCNAESSEFGKWQSFEVSDKNKMQVLVPPSHGVAHLVLSDVDLFHYKQSTYYSRENQFSYRWDDPRFGIQWPIRSPILSDRDRG